MALSDIFLINGREYEWADIHLVVGGVPVSGFRKVSYKESQEKDFLHAKGRLPRSIQRGNKTYTGSLTFTQSEIRAFQTASLGSLLDLKVDVIIAYIPEGSPVIRTVVMKGVEFTDIEETFSQGDKFTEVELPYLALRKIDI